MVVRPAEVVFLIRGWEQLHGWAGVLLVHLTSTSKSASDIPYGQSHSGQTIFTFGLQNFPPGRGKSF